MAAYTNHIQQISNNDKSTITLNKSDIKISLFLNSLIEKYNSDNLMQDLNVYNKTPKIHLDIHPGCEVIKADRIHFANVIDNLIENAIKYSGDTVNINISVMSENKSLRISVIDDGIGISAKDIKRLFEKFYRSNHHIVKRKPGYGLGLTYVKSIVELHGGKVEVKSLGVGEGSEFVINIPRGGD